MQGPGYVPQRRPSTGTLVALRVIFVGIALLSIGFLAWTALLRLAVVTQKARDWFLFALATALDIAAIAFLSVDPGDEISTWKGELGMTLLLGTLMGAIAYYLTFDIRHYQQPGFAAYPAHQPGYGYPQPAPSPYAATQPQTAMSLPPGAQTPVPRPPMPQTPVPQPPVPQTPVPQTPVPQTPVPQTPVPQTPVPQTPAPPPQPGRPAPARIDQVRAELDELSDYLRKHEGGR